MSKAWIPVCHYPTTIVLVDDKANYLTAIKLNLLRSGYAIPKTFVNARHVVELFSKNKPELFTKRVIQRPEEMYRDRRNIDIDIHQIRHEIYNPHRFSQVSAVITDYAMPGMDGLEMCKQIQDKVIKKILLTGEASESLAIQAFNERIIDQFVRKDERDFENVLNNIIHESQMAYFQYLSELITMSLIRDPNNISSCLDDPIFIKFFEDICHKKNVVEYYLLDASGSFLFLDAEGSPSILAVKSASDMQSQWEMACDFQTPPSLIEALQNKQKLVYLHTSEQLKIDPPGWEPYAFAATPIQCKQEVFYTAYLTEKDLKMYGFKREGILSYSEYLEGL